MFWQLLIVLSLTLYIYITWRRRKILKLSKLPESGYSTLPLIGHGLHFAGDNEHIYKTLEKFGRETIKNNGVSTMWVGEAMIVVVADAVMAEFLLKTCLTKGYHMNFFNIAIEHGFFNAPVPIWRPRRKMAMSTFAPRNLKYFFEVFVSKSQLMVDQLSERAGAGAFSFCPYLTAYSMDSVCLNTLGVEINSQKSSDQHFRKFVDNVFELISNRILSPWLYSDAIYKLHPSYRHLTTQIQYGHEFVEQIIKSKRKEIADGLHKGAKQDMEQNRMRSFLELMIDASEDDTGCSDKVLRDDMIIIISAATDTTSAVSGFTTLMLARHQDVQQKVHQELQEVFGDSSRAIHIDDLPQLKYLDCVIKETMRLYSPAPIIIRDIDEDVVLPSGGTLLKGTTVAVAIWALHRNPRYWGADAEQFRPERFLDTALVHPAQYMPFSHGPRNCIGYQYAMMSLMAVMSTLLRRYRVLPETDTPDSPIRLKFSVTVKDINNYMIRLETKD